MYKNKVSVIGKMMFMSTVVHFVEFIMISLTGILMYKLYTSYNAWKNSTAFFAASDSINASRKTFDLSQKAVNTDSLVVNKISASDGKLVAQDLVVKELVAKAPATDNKSSSILNDYIGEFFSEPQVMNLEPYRATESHKALPVSKYSKSSDYNLASSASPTVTSSINDLRSDDEIIQVEPAVFVSNQVNDTKNLKSYSVSEDAIPTLNEFSDLESDSFITVASINDDLKSSNKVMSDKVVMAMLNEAKLVCAS
jgi:hypothetical protein